MEDKKEELNKPAPPPARPAAPPPPPPPAEGQPSSDELRRMRSSNKVFKVLAVILSVFFVVIIGTAIFMYNKLSGIRDILMPPIENYDNKAFRMGEDPMGGPASNAIPGTLGDRPLTKAEGGSSLTMFTNAQEYAGEGGAEPLTMSEAINTADVLKKYADRPIVKDFIAELKKDPDFALALKQKEANDPMAMIASIQKTKSVNGLVLKFASRKDFMPFLMEVMMDPEIKPLLNKMPAGSGAGGMGAMMQMLQSAQSEMAAGNSAPAQRPARKKRAARPAAGPGPQPSPADRISPD